MDLSSANVSPSEGKEIVVSHERTSHGRITLGPPNRDRARPRDPAPPTPPGIRITYHGGSVEMIP
jgi:hypothetical protein